MKSQYAAAGIVGIVGIDSCQHAANTRLPLDLLRNIPTRSQARPTLTNF